MKRFYFLILTFFATVGCNNGSLLSEDCLEASSFKAHEGHAHEEDEDTEATDSEADEDPLPPPCDPLGIED